MARKAALHNLGCKVNAYETEAMRQLLEEAGYQIVPFEPGADVYVINTCTVTNIADRKSRQMLHKARKMNPEAIIVAAGCYVQAAEDQAREDEAIDIVLGNNCKKDLIEALNQFEQVRNGEADTLFDGRIDINHTKEYETLSLNRTEEHTRAYLKVQDGCNQFCSYCIIPYARGRVRSREVEDVLQEARTLAENGCREVVLTGIHLSSYGTDLGTNLLQLILAVHDIEGVDRIRLGSLEPGIVTEEFAATLAGLPKICPHFHLSLQSGCTATLKRMNRRYTAEEFAMRCRILRDAFGDPALTTDVIAGFAGETEEEFAETIAFLKNIELYETHIFKYSRRHGTRAASMPNQVPEQIKAQRSDVLITLGEENRKKFEERYAGRKVSVLLEETMMCDGQEYYTGYTKEYIKMAISTASLQKQNPAKTWENVILEGTVGSKLAPHLFELVL